MDGPPNIPVSLAEHRFSRFERIKWWDQAVLRRARVLVVGAGALGNEVIKNLALLGVGRVAIVDMDRIEQSNLSRSVLFRTTDEGATKAEVAARAAAEIYPELSAIPIVANLLADVGLGLFRWAQVVVGALDNREARLFVNRCCAQVGRPWIDGGIDVLNGIVRGFDPPKSSCYECTMGEADWNLVNKRRSCSLLARAAAAEGGAPTTPTTASIVGAIQAQEVVKRLHNLTALSGAGYVFEGLAHNSFTVEYPMSPDCPWHDAPAEIHATDAGRDTPLRHLADLAKSKLNGNLDAIDLSRELIHRLACPACKTSRDVFKAAESITASEAVCPKCDAEAVPEFFHTIAPDSPLMERTPRQLGLPAWDVLWPRAGAAAIGLELSADRDPRLGDDGN